MPPPAGGKRVSGVPGRGRYAAPVRCGPFVPRGRQPDPGPADSAADSDAAAGHPGAWPFPPDVVPAPA
jgi:hypothetical protein